MATKWAEIGWLEVCVIRDAVGTVGSAFLSGGCSGGTKEVIPPDWHEGSIHPFRDAVDAHKTMVSTPGGRRRQTLRLRHKFADIPKLVSYGACQFPTLGFVVDRHWERQGFVPRRSAKWAIRRGCEVQPSDIFGRNSLECQCLHFKIYTLHFRARGADRSFVCGHGAFSSHEKFIP